MSRQIIMPMHANPRATLFGGHALALIDEAAAITVATVMGHSDAVTKLMSEVEFKAPAFVGDIIEIDSKVLAIGRTSITVDCIIRNVSSQKEVVCVDKIVFVCVHRDGTPKPHGVDVMKIDQSLVRVKESSNDVRK